MAGAGSGLCPFPRLLAGPAVRVPRWVVLRVKLCQLRRTDPDRHPWVPVAVDAPYPFTPGSATGFSARPCLRHPTLHPGSRVPFIPFLLVTHRAEVVGEAQGRGAAGRGWSGASARPSESRCRECLLLPLPRAPGYLAKASRPVVKALGPRVLTSPKPSTRDGRPGTTRLGEPPPAVTATVAEVPASGAAGEPPTRTRHASPGREALRAWTGEARRCVDL